MVTHHNIWHLYDFFEWVYIKKNEHIAMDDNAQDTEKQRYTIVLK